MDLGDPCKMRIRGFLSVIRTRKIKFSSIQFCIGDLVLFDFIYFQLSYLYGLFLLVLSICYHDFVIKITAIFQILNLAFGKLINTTASQYHTRKIISNK